jgi:hypothetical protein
MSDLNAANDKSAEWQEAEARVRAYLQALQVVEREEQDRIIALVLSRSAVLQMEHPNDSPLSLAMREIRTLAEQWLGQLLVHDERAAVTGFVYLFALDATQKWPTAFLADEIPQDFRQALQTCEVNAAPNLRVSTMVPQPFESPLQDINLVSGLGQLTKNLSPSVVARAVTFIVSCLPFVSSNRVR